MQDTTSLPASEPLIPMPGNMLLPQPTELMCSPGPSNMPQLPVMHHHIPHNQPMEQHVSPDMLQLGLFDYPTQVCGMQGCKVYARQDALMQALGVVPTTTVIDNTPANIEPSSSPGVLWATQQPESASPKRKYQDNEEKWPDTPSDYSPGIAIPDSQEDTPICSNCGTTDTPLWRRNHNTLLLCNACGLYLKIHKKQRPMQLRRRHINSSRSQANERRGSDTPGCNNCGTKVTPLWRKDAKGGMLCNACGLYQKLHKSDRPVRYRADVIRKRSRYDSRARDPQETMTPPQMNASTPGDVLPNINADMSVPMTLQDPMTVSPTCYDTNAPCKTGNSNMHLEDESSNNCTFVKGAQRVLELTDEPLSSPALLACCASSTNCTGPVLLNDNMPEYPMGQMPSMSTLEMEPIEGLFDHAMEPAKPTLWPVYSQAMQINTPQHQSLISDAVPLHHPHPL